MNIGYSVFIVALSIVAYLMYVDVTIKRMNNFFKRNDLTEEARHTETRDSWRDRMAALARIALYAVSAVFAFMGNFLGIILTWFFTIEGFGYIFWEATKAKQDMAVAMTYLAIPFGAVVACAISKWTSSIILGLIIGLALVVAVRFASSVIAFFKRNFTAKDEASAEADEKGKEEEEKKSESPKPTTRRQNVKGAK